jgi:glycosyltransferase involved in cell wall biosynthesis
MNHPISVPVPVNENRTPDIGCWPETSPPEHHALGKFEHSVSLMVWAHNEADLIESFVERATGLLDRTVQDWEIVFIDNCSTDRTPTLLRALVAREPRLKVFRHMRILESGLTYRSALHHAKKGFCFWQTIDWSYDLSNLRIFLELLKHFDVVTGIHPVPTGTGSAYGIHGSIYRARHGGERLANVVLAFGYYSALRILFGMPLHDFQNINFVGTKRARQFEFTSRTSFIHAELLLRSYHDNRRFIEVPIHARPQEGRSDNRLYILFELLRNWLTRGAWQRILHLARPRRRVSRVSETERLKSDVAELVMPLRMDYAKVQGAESSIPLSRDRTSKT